MAKEKLPPPLLENMIHEILSEPSKYDCYPGGMQEAFKDCTQVKVSHDHIIYKECIKCLAFMCKKNDLEKFYEKFYSSLPLQAETLLNKAVPESLCKVIVLHFGDKLLAFSKPSSSQRYVEISLKDAERGPLNYPGGYIMRNLYRKHQSKASKKTNICQEKEEFMALLDSLHVDEPAAKDTAFISAKVSGGLWYPKEYLTDIFVTEELQFCAHTGKEICHKICVDKIVDILLQKPVLRSKWNMLMEECGFEITKGRSIIFLDQILSLFIKIRSFSYAKDIVQKYKIQQKATKKKGLRKEIKRATNPKCAGLMFHHFFHHQRIFEGLMQRMMSSQSCHVTSKVQNVFKGNNLHRHLVSPFY